MLGWPISRLDLGLATLLGMNPRPLALEEIMVWLRLFRPWNKFLREVNQWAWGPPKDCLSLLGWNWWIFLEMVVFLVLEQAWKPLRLEDQDLPGSGRGMGNGQAAPSGRVGLPTELASQGLGQGTWASSLAGLDLFSTRPAETTASLVNGTGAAPSPGFSGSGNLEILVQQLLLQTLILQEQVLNQRSRSNSVQMDVDAVEAGSVSLIPCSP